jgi:hypothetical protein
MMPYGVLGAARWLLYLLGSVAQRRIEEATTTNSPRHEFINALLSLRTGTTDRLAKAAFNLLGQF